MGHFCKFGVRSKRKETVAYSMRVHFVNMFSRNSLAQEAEDVSALEYALSLMPILRHESSLRGALTLKLCGGQRASHRVRADYSRRADEV